MGINGTDYAAHTALERVGETAVFRAVDSEDDFVLAVFFVNPFDLQHNPYFNCETPSFSRTYSATVLPSEAAMRWISSFCAWLHEIASCLRPPE